MTLPTPFRSNPARAAYRSLGVLLAAVTLAHWPTVVGFLQNWLTSYQPGLIIGALVVFLVWRDWPRIVADPTPPPVPTWVLIVPGALLWYLAAFLEILVVQQFLLPALLLVWLVSVAGWRVLRRLAPILLILPLAYPYWGWLTRPLQLVTIQVNRILLFFTGLEADVQGEFVRIPYGTFVILGSCSGYTYFMVGTVMGVAYAYLFLRRRLHRLAVVGLAMGLALVANWIRVFGLILIGYASEMQSPLMADHGNYGWIIFAVCMAAFLGLAGIVDRRDQRWQAAHGAPGQDAPLPAGPPRVASAGTLPATAAILVGPVLLVLSSMIPDVRTPTADPVGLAPSEAWERQDDAATPWAFPPRFQGADEHRVAAWRNDGAVVRVDRFIYRTQSQGKELVNSENRIAPDSLVAVARTVGPLPPGGRRVREAWVRSDEGLVLTWYWYVVDGIGTPSDRTAKLLEFPAFLARGPASELVSVSTPCDGESCEQAARRLASFVTGIDEP